MTTILEVLQILVGMVGLSAALTEIRSSWAIWRANHVGHREHYLSQHHVLIECLRISVHTMIIIAGAMMLNVPPPPRQMPYYVEVVVEKIFLVLIAAIAATGSVRARQTRLHMRGMR